MQAEIRSGLQERSLQHEFTAVYQINEARLDRPGVKTSSVRSRRRHSCTSSCRAIPLILLGHYSYTVHRAIALAW